MAATTTPPPPKSNNTGFVAAAVVMLLLMGGLIWWKVGGAKEQPVATPPPPPPTSAPPVFENTAPPPPKLEEDAGTPEKKPEVKRVVGGGGGGCAGECKGTGSPQLQSALRSKAGAARGCYERALRQNPMLQGKMTVSLRIGPGGVPCSVNVQNGLGDPGVGSCVAGLFRSSTFPAPTGGCVDATVPLNFVPKGAAP